VLVAIAKKELGVDRSLSEILQVLSISLFENSPILQAVNAIAEKAEDRSLCNHWEWLKS